MQILDWVVVGIYFILMSVIVVLARKAKSMHDFAVGSKQIPGTIIFATLSATFIGPGYSMGLANKAADKGYVWLFIFLFFSLQTILVGRFIAPKLQKFHHAYTLSDIMGYRYGKLVKLISGILSVALCAGFVGVIARASGEIISSITGISFFWAVILSTIVVVAYSAFGGIKMVILTDVLQFIVLAITIPLTLILMIGKHGTSTLVEAIPKESLTIGGHFPLTVLFTLFLSFFLGETLIPPYANRAFMAQDSDGAKKGFLLTGLFSIAWFTVCASIGILGKAANVNINGNIFLATMHSYLPVGLLGLAIAALISIVMSSQDSILHAASISFNNDILATFSTHFDKDLVALNVSRWTTVIIGIFATIFALNVPGIVEALLYCYTLWAPTVVLPLIIGAVKKDVHPYAGLAAIVVGGLATAIWEWVFNNPYQVPSLLVGVITNQLIFWLIQSIIKKQANHKLLVPLTQDIRKTMSN